MKTKNKAFTLAETLVVMGIIGVIAALTVPNLSQSTGNKEKVTKVQKFYANLQEALDRATAIYGPYDNWGLTNNRTNDDQIVGDRITEFMKLSKNCRRDTTCTINGGFTNAAYRFQTADGTIVSLAAIPSGFTFDIYQYKPSEKITRGKNSFRGSFGYDSGGMYLKNLDRDFSTLKSAVTYCVTNPGGTDGEGTSFYYCADGSLIWLLKYGNIDYLKFNSTGVCSNGTTPTEANPRCN